MLTLAAPLSREVGEGLPKVREFWRDLSLGSYRGMGAEFIRLAARSLIKGHPSPDRAGGGAYAPSEEFAAALYPGLNPLSVPAGDVLIRPRHPVLPLTRAARR
jgi:hypothetical protein